MDKLEEIFDMQEALNARIGVKTEGMNDDEKAKWLLNYTRPMRGRDGDIYITQLYGLRAFSRKELSSILGTPPRCRDKQILNCHAGCNRKRFFDRVQSDQVWGACRTRNQHHHR